MTEKLTGPEKEPSRFPLAAFTDNPSPILDRLAAGESVAQLATSLGISRQAVYAWLLAHCPDEWMAISASNALTRLEQAEAELGTADDNVKISRARELIRAAQWNVERTARKLYGDNKADASGVTVNVILDRSCGGEVIEQE